jgi:hypothetical protein
MNKGYDGQPFLYAVSVLHYIGDRVIVVVGSNSVEFEGHEDLDNIRVELFTGLGLNRLIPGVLRYASGCSLV